MKQFEISIVVRAANATQQDAEYAVKCLLARASRHSPDARFNWSEAAVTATEYAGVVTR